MIPSPPAIEKTGFFHFGAANRSDPVKALESELGTRQDLTNSLIVLPEALNILNDYMTSSDPDPSVDRRLKEMSMSLGVALATGLIVQRGGKRRSCACLIDGGMCRILTCKTDDDRSHNYQPYPGAFDQPTLHRGVCLAALVCNDATENPPDGDLQKRQRRHQALADAIEARRQGAPAVLCIPGRMCNISSEAVVDYWSSRLNAAVIVANGTPNHPRVVRFGGPPRCSGGDENAVRLYSWAEFEPKH